MSETLIFREKGERLQFCGIVGVDDPYKALDHCLFWVGKTYMRGFVNYIAEKEGYIVRVENHAYLMDFKKRCNRCHAPMAGITAYDGSCKCGGRIEACPEGM